MVSLCSLAFSRKLYLAAGGMPGKKPVHRGQIHERPKFELGADFVNPFNIVRWSDPSTLPGGGTFGDVTSTPGTARDVRITAKIHFGGAP